MSKKLNCQTVICKVKGITILDLSLNSTTNDNSIDEKYDKNGVNRKDNIIVIDDNADDIQMLDSYYENNTGEGTVERDVSEEETEQTPRIVAAKGVYEMEEVNTSIESVRQYVHTTRRDGKVWHQCRWSSQGTSNKRCDYGSKWSGAMVNHIRSHLGIKPFRCLYCCKLFTIACNLKNHLRTHHGLKAKIVLNGGRRAKESGDSSGAESSQGVTTGPEVTRGRPKVQKVKKSSIKSKVDSKLRIFKPSFMNGKIAGNPYTPERRTLPKRTVKKNQKYIDFQEDFEDEEQEVEPEQTYSGLNEEEAEEENRKFYQKTVDEEEDDSEDLSRFIVKRKYNKKLWFVCVWNPRQCKYRSHLKSDVSNHVKKHQNIRQYICNWNHCSASFVNQQMLENHQLIHRRQKFFKCNFPNCEFQTINETALKMHKIRHKRQI